ncbi:hypothetical protein Gbfr_005_135 [Gluconobacter frateurii M-2]|nr:hypothetical protein Gbfr_005_135 [Gluconobacter frateurii M-2]
MCPPQGKQQSLRNNRIHTPPAGNNNRVRLIQKRQITIWHDAQSRSRAKGSLFQTRYDTAVPVRTDFRSIQAKDLYGAAKFEGTQPVISENGDKGTCRHRQQHSGRIRSEMTVPDTYISRSAARR